MFSFDAGLKWSLKFCKDKIFMFEFDTIESILPGRDVGIFGCIIIYHVIK